MNFFASNTMVPQPTFYTFTRGMFCSIRTWSTPFKLQHYFWELGLVFLPPKRALPPNPPPPASLFTTKSDTSKAFQTTAIPVRTGLVFPPFPIVCLKPSLCTCKTHYLTCVEIYVYTVSQTRIQHHGASTYILHVHKGHVLQYTHTWGTTFKLQHYG